jgi:glutathione S-transferase
VNITKTPTITIRRTFNAPRERVFSAFTDAAVLERWMGPPGSSITHASFDAREGGSYRLTFNSPEYGEMTAKGIVTALRRPEHLAYTWRWEEDDAADEHDTSVRIDFIDRGDQTEMLFTHDGFATEESRDRHELGWNGALSKIDSVL